MSAYAPSKALGSDDSSGFEFAQEMLCGDPTYAVNFDRIQYHPQKGYIIFEYLRCHESQTVTPYTSHPNRYFHKNRRKFEALYRIAQDLQATLYLVNYAAAGTPHADEILLMRVQSVNAEAEAPVQTEDFRTNRAAFSRWFRNLNAACA
ncbi:hypothetical protein [Bergeriella denitrificans]|uniref:Uncharacterized protein n=1 Tax=Bergeriella denitrificans TaxID=494 RepID=A0A378ULP4_BERDE|nr:hypothetical protein [Bergeriella denitrificans]STZ77421.1 Uncharacterised protein [Bergeriella denitrificans]